MSDAITLSAKPRSDFGKGFARRARAAGYVPAVVYGHGEAPQHLSLPAHDTMMALKQANALLTIKVEGGESILALAKDVQRNAVRRTIEHVDLLLVRKGEKVQVEVPVHVVGDAAPGTVVTIENSTLLVEAEATHLPEAIELSIQGVPAGTLLHAKDVTLPKGSSLVDDPELTIVNIAQQVSAQKLQAELGESAEESAAE